ncbi:DUF547 domain-containing protein [Tunicatimonas pelagia]|uniref:DUF547 domain-containing protein n=1 Tax=Tunicatimonas pelagia TaxID=931531 RepID=UPI002665873A|nr:DUF547 domain-containing protein [Tunicatimonas pelagia]WKN40998.1 DUF547 domain-containing protein [Tunicatimonas pelagia]
MMKAIIATILAYVFIPFGVADFTKNADDLLENQVNNGLVNYEAIANNPTKINLLYEEVGSASLEGISDEEKKAFYINAYNIVTIYQIIQHYPVKSPMNINGFFDKNEHKVAGKSLTLNELEKEHLLKDHFDARAHFVLVCAAMSCPPLASFAYQADQLDQQLEERTREALNDPKFIQVDKSKKKVRISKIFDWYKGDFTKNQASVLQYINQYRTEKIPESYKVGYYEYSWALNEQ